ncbi:MAG: glycosyltransferase family 61 protein [Pseudomonadota bacterium]
MFFAKKIPYIFVKLRNPENITIFTKEIVDDLNRHTKRGIYWSMARYYKNSNNLYGYNRHFDYGKKPAIPTFDLVAAEPRMKRIKDAYVNWQMFVFDQNKKLSQDNLTSFWEWDDLLISTKKFTSKSAEFFLKIFHKIIPAECQFIIRKKIAFKKFAQEIFTRKNRIEEVENAIVFTDQYWFVFGHYMLDNYARLYYAMSQLSALEKKSVKIILPPRQNLYYTDKNSNHVGFIEASLQALGISDEQKIYGQEDVILKVKNLLLPLPARHHPIIPQALTNLKNHFVDDSLYEGEQRIERLYISRKRSDRRRIVNEEELEKFLAKKGFKTVAMEDYDFKTQINLLKNVKVLVGPDSSSIANIAFCNSPKYLIFTAQDTTSIFLSTVVDQPYYYQFCEPENKENFNWYSSNIIVDLAELEKNLLTLLK